MPSVVIYVAVVMLFLGAAPLPYGYYMLLRIVVTIVFIWSAYVSYVRKRKIIPWIFCLGAIMFNPLFKIYFPKELWAIIDVAAGVFLLVNKKHLQKLSDVD